MVRDRSTRRCDSRSLRSPLPRRMPSNGYRPEHFTRTTIGPSRPHSPLVRKRASFSGEGQGRWGTIRGAISSDCGRLRGRRSREGKGVRRRPSREEEEKLNRRSFFRGEPLGSPPQAGPEGEQEQKTTEEPHACIQFAHTEAPRSRLSSSFEGRGIVCFGCWSKERTLGRRSSGGRAARRQ